jgi:CRISPR-associated protein Csx17
VTLHLHHLTGCAPTPLAHYLKALGVLRIVGEQKDRAARGWWQDEHFCLLTTLDRAELERFFLDEYKPTPLLAPWNGASGFFRTWDKKSGRLRKSKNGRALEELVASADVRLSLFKEAHRRAVSALGPRLRKVDVSAISDDDRKKLLIVPDGEGPTFPVATKDDEGKGAVQRAMLRACSSNPFYGSSIVDTRDGSDEDKIAYPSMWGSGGNDGAIDYSGRYFENVLQVTTEEHSASSLRSALSGEIAGDVLTGAAGKVGQFLPSGAGGANVANGPGSAP